MQNFLNMEKVAQHCQLSVNSFIQKVFPFRVGEGTRISRLCVNDEVLWFNKRLFAAQEKISQQHKYRNEEMGKCKCIKNKLGLMLQMGIE